MDCTKEVAQIFVERFNTLNIAVENDDLSQASFPLTGEEARLELRSKRDTLLWALEMLNIGESDMAPNY